MKTSFSEGIHVITEEQLHKYLHATDKHCYSVRIFIEYSIKDTKGINKIVMKNISKENMLFWHQYYCILAEEYGRNFFENQ